MTRKRNILFIMADQLRADYLGCTGHATIRTPNIDALAARGVSFSRAYVQSPVCGPSRMSTYTGRYVATHGSYWNTVPLPVGEMTLGDHLRPLGADAVLIGKTHMQADRAGMERLGIDPSSPRGVRLAQCGFEPFERDDGLHPDEANRHDLAYNRYLAAKGYPRPNPWHTHANAAVGEDGELRSGWLLRNAPLPADIREEDSETAWMTDRFLDFLHEDRVRPWVAHLSYIKPHWPYIAPAPYHAMYGPDDVQPVLRSERERTEAHPVTRAYMARAESVNFSREDVRLAVIPTYMGLVSQIDDHVGRIVETLRAQGRLDDTIIVFTSDHGDYLGDHWLGDKELFHEQSCRVPLIIVDPDPAADSTRGTVCDALVECIDLAPTFVEAMGGTPPGHILEGRSLIPWLRGETPDWRDAVFSEIDYSFRRQRLDLGLPVRDARAAMVRTERYKYIHHERFRPQLYDLQEDPDEMVDLGEDPGHAAVREEMVMRLLAWQRGLCRRVTMSDAEIEAETDMEAERGIIIGKW